MTVLRRFATCFSTVLLALVAAASGAQPPLTAKNFPHRLEKLDQAARAGSWELLHRESDRLLHELNDSLSAAASDQEPNRKALATVLSFRALSESARGRTREAIWDWFLAQDLWPTLRGATLSDYGEPAALLRDNPWVPAKSKDTDEAVPTEVDHPSRDVKPPVKIRSPNPVYPRGANRENVEATVILHAIISETGEVTMPRILKAPAPSFSVAAAEAVREWLFRPATLDGEPVCVYYNLAINFGNRAHPPKRRPPTRDAP